MARKRRIDAALDQPRQRDAGKIGGDQGNNAEQEQPAVAVNEKLDPVVVAKNLSILWFAVGVRKRTGRVSEARAYESQLCALCALCGPFFFRLQLVPR